MWTHSVLLEQLFVDAVHSVILEQMFVDAVHLIRTLITQWFKLLQTAFNRYILTSLSGTHF